EAPALSRPPPPRHAQERAGLVFAGLCALNGAFNPGFAKLMTTALPGLTVAAFTTLFGAIAAVLVLAAKRELAGLLDPRTSPRFAAMGALGTGLAFFLFFEGAQRSSAIETALCLQVEPVYSLVLARIALGHPITRARLASVAGIIGGIALALEARGA